VLIARGALPAALAEVEAGCAAQDKQTRTDDDYAASGLHQLRGLVLGALGREDDAMRAFACELAIPDRGQLYYRETAARTSYARGALHLRWREFTEATHAFRQALAIAPGYFFARAALGLPLPTLAPNDPRATDVGFAAAVALVRAGRHPDGAKVYTDALVAASSLNSGWDLPIEPILQPALRPDIWDEALTIVARRAT
jgi:hypothetical protein